MTSDKARAMTCKPLKAVFKMTVLKVYLNFKYNNVNQDGQSEILIIPLPTLRPIIPSLATTTSDMATQRAFFQFVVEQALAGESDDIKASVVATQVFGRRENLDQATDPIVSIQVNKLRRALEHY
jgi:hypothetical protein